MIIVRIVQFIKIVQLVQLDYYGYIKFFGGFVGTWVGAFTILLLININKLNNSLIMDKYINISRGATIREHQIATATISAHNLCFRKVLHPS